MDTEEFRKQGKLLVDYIADYLENIEKRRVVPAVEPGYLRHCLPHQAPTTGESFHAILQDVEKFIMPGVTHWQHPRFHAYFPAGNSYPSILADMLSDALGCVGFSWAACPAMTELEMIMLDWLGRMIGLPSPFLPFTEGGRGGGVIQSSASECILVSLLAARFDRLQQLKARFPFVEEGVLLSKLIAYCSKEAHSSVEKASMIGLVKLRILETDKKFRLRGETVKNAMEEDRNMGLIPFFVATTLGTTSCCSFDALNEIGPVCSEEQVWLHVDAAYAGSSFICPEFQPLMEGIEHANSFNTNPNKWMLVNFDISTMWVTDRFKLTQALVVDPLYLQHGWMDKAIDYRHWGIPLSRRFRSLKLWFVIRMYGLDGLQNYIREHVRLAKKFERLVRGDSRFEVINEVKLGLVCFRLKIPHIPYRGGGKIGNDVSKRLLTRINASGKLHMVPARLGEKFVIRFCVCHEKATDKDITIAWEIIRSMANDIIVAETEPIGSPLKEENPLEKGIEEEEEAEGVAGAVGGGGVRNGEEEEMEDDVGEGMGGSPPRDQGDRKNHSLAYKRSFFVRMVSDPKCYNPKIVRTLSKSRRRLSEDLKRDMALKCDIRENAQAWGSTEEEAEGEENEDVAVEETGIQTPM